MKTRLLAILIGLGAAAGTHLAQVAVDPVRRESQEQWRTLAMPRADTLRVASMGQATLAADFVWLRSVLRFADTFQDPGRSDVVWLAAMIDAVVALDPDWRTAYFYGGSMLRVVGDIQSSDQVFQQARARPALAEDPYFPFALGINAWLHHGDPVLAASYLNEAASLPGAPAWYRTAAAGIMDQERGRAAAIEMLRRSLASETDDRVRTFLEDKLKRLMHDELAERLTEAMGDRLPPWRTSLEVLPDGQALPPDPMGAGWVVCADGGVCSQLIEEEERARALNSERHWLMFPIHTRPPKAGPADPGALPPAEDSHEEAAEEAG